MASRTVAYLHSALEDAGTSVLKITGRDSFADRVAIVEGFRRSGGLLVCTDAGIFEGIELREVTPVIYYDAPTNPITMEQRWRKVDRYWGTTLCTLFWDDSRAITFESEIIDRLYFSR